jgi:hypothetical protein
MSFLPIEHQVLFLAPLQDFIQILETMIKGFAINREVIHEDFYDFFNHVAKDRHHVPLE